MFATTHPIFSCEACSIFCDSSFLTSFLTVSFWSNISTLRHLIIIRLWQKVCLFLSPSSTPSPDSRWGAEVVITPNHPTIHPPKQSTTRTSLDIAQNNITVKRKVACLIKLDPSKLMNKFLSINQSIAPKTAQISPS